MANSLTLTTGITQGAIECQWYELVDLEYTRVAFSVQFQHIFKKILAPLGAVVVKIPGGYWENSSSLTM